MYVAERANSIFPDSVFAQADPISVRLFTQLLLASTNVLCNRMSALRFFFGKVDAEATFLNSLNMRVETSTCIAIEVCGDLFKVRSCDCASRISAATAARPSPGAEPARRHPRLIRAVAALQTDIAFGEERLFRRGAVAQRFALFIEREESRLADAFPFGRAFARQRFKTVGVIVEPESSKARLQPGLKALLHARDERQNSLAPGGAIGFSLIAEGVIAGQTQQQRRHAEGERDLARRA